MGLKFMPHYLPVAERLKAPNLLHTLASVPVMGSGMQSFNEGGRERSRAVVLAFGETQCRIATVTASNYTSCCMLLVLRLWQG